jgi:hypothetical protein
MPLASQPASLSSDELKDLFSVLPGTWVEAFRGGKTYSLAQGRTGTASGCWRWASVALAITSR